MEATILSKDLTSIGVVDNYKSFIWNDRFDEAGNFELCVPMQDGSFPINLNKGDYLWRAESDRIMIVETVGYDSDEESGCIYNASGRSYESILTRRIVWYKRVFSADDNGNKPNLQNGIAKLLMENAIEPTEEQVIKYGVKNPITSSSPRKIPNLTFEESTDERITKLEFEAQYLGENLYDVIHTQCVENEIGFKITLNENDQFVFKLCAGEDRSYGTEDEPQFKNPYVVFSPQFDNLLSASYLDSDEKLKNVCLIVGESEYDEEGEEISRISYELGNEAGLERREIFTDATSLSLEDELGGIMTADRYRAHLKQKGMDTLIENTPIAAIAAEIEPRSSYVYGEDYHIGDIVQIIDRFGQESRAYISEYITSCDESGTNAYPTFKLIQKGVYEE